MSPNPVYYSECKEVLEVILSGISDNKLQTYINYVFACLQMIVNELETFLVFTKLLKASTFQFRISLFLWLILSFV